MVLKPSHSCKLWPPPETNRGKYSSTCSLNKGSPCSEVHVSRKPKQQKQTTKTSYAPWIWYSGYKWVKETVCYLCQVYRPAVVHLRHTVFQCYNWFWSCLPLWTAACLHSISYTTLFFWHLHAGNPTVQTQDSWLPHLLLLWTPHLEFSPTRP